MGEIPLFRGKDFIHQSYLKVFMFKIAKIPAK